MIVLSLFDGISATQLALKRAGIPVETYYACEVDKYAMSITNYNFPNTVQLGDINEWKKWDIKKPDLIIGGSPCQGFSLAGKGLNFDDPRSKLFFVFVNILRHYNPKWFLLENVKMKSEWKDIISEYMKVSPIEINSSLVSAQSRKRLYWTNIPTHQPENKGIVLKDVIEDGIVDREKFYCIDANYFKGGNLEQYFAKSRRQQVFSETPLRIGTAKNINGHDYLKRVYSIIGKSPTVVTLTGGNQKIKIATNKKYWRNLSPVECERLQTFPDNYTEYGIIDGKKKKISNTQRYKTLGNSFTVDVITHILSKTKG